ncbi:AraC family transcriptional regulator [Kineothrix sp. MB12-C1]|uniref:AraC family transcriptional regulator n=1 Tax=Kineothrix sp. MB12-C1 TaxID=3070215 RepID=UPI0027D27A83|nr:AraC family transcriptional regulator [Kineothrix sp. MB12-C1]WMC91541.1 AraC family transcriptional regulator [Kineothrix sp. MB12-C1]
MNFTNDFESYMVSPPRLSPDKSPLFFLGNIYEPGKDIDEKLISILSGGSLEASFPYSFQLNPLNCYLLLYTENGYGKLHYENSIYSLESNTLLFVKCDQRFKLEIAVSPWNYKVFFIKGEILDFYSKLLLQYGFPLYTPPEHSTIIRNIQKLALNGTTGEIRNKLYDSRILTDIICDLLMESMEAENPVTKAPGYLQEIKALFDIAYQESYTLNELENHFSISKYRLCREFSMYYGESPLQYLNARRVEIAKDLLLTTDYRIHEIGSLVGIDNTNHFIYLFKKETGMTPLSYKQKSLNIIRK